MIEQNKFDSALENLFAVLYIKFFQPKVFY